MKIWGASWAPFQLKQWQPSHNTTAASRKSVDMGTRPFLDGETFLHFWALAPTVQGVRRNTLVGTTEFVWLIDDDTHHVWHALVDKETDQVYWRLEAGWQGRGQYAYQGQTSAVAA